jgi:putative transposase
VFLRILAHKAECAGRELIPVDPRNTSRTCPTCGQVSKENREREMFECTGFPSCSSHSARLVSRSV